MEQAPSPKKRGRPPLKPDQKRSERLQSRVPPDVKAKIDRNTSDWFDAVIRRAKEPTDPKG